MQYVCIWITPIMYSVGLPTPNEEVLTKIHNSSNTSVLRGRFWETKKVTHTTMVYRGTTSVVSTKALESSGNLIQIQMQHLTCVKQVLYN